VPYTISGAGITSGDFDSMQVNGSSISTALTGNFIIQNGVSTLRVVVAADRSNEGAETFTVRLNNGLAVSVTINDTSTPVKVSELKLQSGSPIVYSGTAATISIEPDVYALAVLCIGAGGNGGATTDPGQAPAYGAGGGAGGWVASTYFILGKPVQAESGGKKYLWDQTSLPGWANVYSKTPDISYNQMVTNNGTEYATVVGDQVSVDFSNGSTIYGSRNFAYLRGNNGATGSSGSQSGGIRPGGAGGTYSSLVPARPDMAGGGATAENSYKMVTFTYYLTTNTGLSPSPLAKGAPGLVKNTAVPQDVYANNNLSTYGYGAGGGGRFRSNTNLPTGAPGAIYVWKFVAP
jgi:hypothetical protein